MFIDDSYVDNIKTKDLVDLGQSIQGVNAGRITFVTVPTVGYADEYGNETPRTEDMRALFDAIINDDPLPEEKNPTTRRCPARPSRRRARRRTPTRASVRRHAGAAGLPELVNAVTTNPQDITVRVSNSTGEDGLAATAASELRTAWLQRDHARRLPRASDLDDGVLLAGQRAGRRDGRLGVHQPDHRAGRRHGRRGAGGARVATSTRSRRRRPAAHRCRSTSCTAPVAARRTCPRISPSPTPPIRRANKP